MNLSVCVRVCPWLKPLIFVASSKGVKTLATEAQGNARKMRGKTLSPGEAQREFINRRLASVPFRVGPWLRLLIFVASLPKSAYGRGGGFR